MSAHAPTVTDVYWDTETLERVRSLSWRGTVQVSQIQLDRAIADIRQVLGREVAYALVEGAKAYAVDLDVNDIRTHVEFSDLDEARMVREAAIQSAWAPSTTLSELHGGPGHGKEFDFPERGLGPITVAVARPLAFLVPEEDPPGPLEATRVDYCVTGWNATQRRWVREPVA